MVFTADWIVPVGLGILGSLIALWVKGAKPAPARIKNHRTRR